jgi:hypothetical protein
LSNYQEYHLGTNPISANGDSDSDGASDAYEVNVLATDPFNPDTDYDGVGDYAEYGVSNPLDPDTDDDGLNDGLEAYFSANPNSWDSDSDYMSDGWEYTYFSDPMGADPYADPDNDTFTNLQEYQGQTDPTDPGSHP